MLVIDIEIGFISEVHDLAHGAGAVARFHRRCNLGQSLVGDDAVKDGTIGFAQRTFELLPDKTGTAAGDVNVLADEVAVHLGDEVIEVQVDVFHRTVQLAGEVVAQPLGVELLLQIALGRDEGAA